MRNLAERDLLTLESSPADRRVTRLVPTERSLAAKESTNTVWSGTIQSAMGRLSDEQVAALRAASGALHALDQALHTEKSRRS